MKAWLLGLVGLALVACQPGDPHGKTVKERLDEGEIIEFTQPGFRHNGCKEQMPDWKMRLSNQTERHRVVLGQQGSVLNPGIYSCYRVGSQVDVEIFKENNVSGRVGISKISWAHIDSVTKGRMKGKYFASSEQYNQYLAGVKSRLQYQGEPYVTILDFDYVRGSALDEKLIAEEDQKGNEGDGFEETLKDGESLSRCQKDWVDMLVDKTFHPAIFAGALGSWFQLGQRNCFKQGQTVVIKEKLGDSPEVAKVVIKKIKKVKISYLDARFFVLRDFDYSVLRDFILAANAKKNEEFITIMDLELQAEK